MRLDLTMPAFEPVASALVVDDDEDIAYLLRHMLERAGFSVRVAEDGRTASDIIASAMPADIVILDLMLPYVDGFELITRIREDNRWRDVPVIVMSGKVTENDAVRALELGANDYVTKPCNPRELEARVRRHLALRRGA